jgi:ABC-type lipoprotein export system ATPase subunit
MPAIRFEHVGKTYLLGSSLVHALRGVSFEIPAGAFTAVVGRSGSGKSTLLHLLAAMETPTSGTITVGDTDLGTLGAKAQAKFRRETVGMIFQRFNLVPTMTALDNVALPLILAGADKSARADRAAECLRLVGLEARVHHRPSELSGGEQQRVAIARALVHDPPLILCDEPTGNLDSATGQQVVDILARVHAEQGKGIVLVTHHPDEIEHLAERTLTLADGRLEGAAAPTLP